MRLKRCAMGHFYDSDLQPTCPACARGLGTIEFAEDQARQAQRNLEEARLKQQNATIKPVPRPTSDDPRDWTIDQVWTYGPFLDDTGVCEQGHFYNEHLFGIACPECEKQKHFTPMDIQRCPNGHIYDASKQKTCPRCGAEGQQIEAPDTEAPITERPSDFTYNAWEHWEHEPWIGKCSKGHSYNRSVYGSRCPLCDNAEIISEGSWSNFFADRSPDPVWRTAAEVEMLGGAGTYWNACLARAGRGKGHVAVAEGLNAIGRGAGNHIVIPSDQTIAFKEHAFILCDSLQKVYYLIAGRTGGKTLINGQQIGKGQAVALADGDAISFGETDMVFFTQPKPPEKSGV